MSDYREHHLTVDRTARYWTLGGDGAGDPDEVWFVLHGYKQLARRFLRRFEAIANEKRLVVAPEGLSRFYVSSGGGRHGAESVVGASWMTREDRLAEIDDYVRYLDRLADRFDSGARVTVLGFSQGVATASRWVTAGAIRPRRLLLWGDFLPPDLDLERAEEAMDGVEVVLVRGSDDPALSPKLAAREAERLAGTRLQPRTVTYIGGHDIDGGTLEALAAEPGDVGPSPHSGPAP